MNDKQIKELEFPYSESELSLLWIKYHARFYIITEGNLSAVVIIGEENGFLKGYQVRKDFLNGRGYHWNYSEIAMWNGMLDENLEKEKSYLTSDFLEFFNHINKAQ